MTEPEVFDPAIHDSAAYKWVTCTSCTRTYICTPGDDYYQPRGVCEPCLLTKPDGTVLPLRTLVWCNDCQEYGLIEDGHGDTTWSDP